MNEPINKPVNKQVNAPMNQHPNHGKKALIFGVANQLSIAWHIVQKLDVQGVKCMIVYQDAALSSRVEKLAATLEHKPLLHICDVTDKTQMDALFDKIAQKWGSFDMIVHAIAFADRSELQGPYYQTSLENFTNSMHVSCYSLTDICARSVPFMKEKGGSVITLTYYGSQKYVPNYNVMGVAKAALEASVRYLAVDMGAHHVRVNAISAGPIRTLAASGIRGFRDMLDRFEEQAPLKKATTQSQVAGAASFLLSDESDGITGDILYVDSGFHVMGMAGSALEA